MAPPPPSPYDGAVVAPGAPEGAPPSQIDPVEERELKAKRDRLIEKFTVMQCDLGGAFYEMAIRDHVRMDVLTRKAAELQEVDAELSAIERILSIAEARAAGLCSTCGTPYGLGVLFCSHCGNSVTAQVGP